MTVSWPPSLYVRGIEICGLGAIMGLAWDPLEMTIGNSAIRANRIRGAFSKPPVGVGDWRIRVVSLEREAKSPSSDLSFGARLTTAASG